MKKPFVLFLVFAACLMASPAFAEDKKPDTPSAPPPAAAAAPPANTAPLAPVPAETEAAKIPDTSGILFVQNLRKAGTTIYYLGEALGLHGWFALKDKQVQIFYTTPDNRAIIIGALLSAEGANISQQQLALFAQSRPEIMDLLKGTVPDSADSSSPPPPATASNAAPEGATPSSEGFYADLQKARQVSFGKETAPTVLMVMDVNCTFCRNTWKKLEKAVDEGKLHLVMIPVAALGARSVDEAAIWISSKNPQEAWKKHIAGDTKVFEGTPEPDKQAAIVGNTQLITKWKVDHTPYLLYHGKSGKIRLIVGEPASSDVILNDIGG